MSPINADIQTYNAYTSYCATHSTDRRCGATTNGLTAAACYTGSGTPDPSCAGGDIANPYWNAPVQGLLDPNAYYLPYSTIPGGIGTGVNAYTYPYVASLILQYKHKKLAVTPSFQFVAGNRYGAPETMPGIDPAFGCAAIAGAVTTGDPRYPYGAAGGVTVRCNDLQRDAQRDPGFVYRSLRWSGRVPRTFSISHAPAHLV